MKRDTSTRPGAYFRAILVVATLLIGSTASLAQEFPNKSLAIIVPFQPGGATDVLARLLSSSMASSLGQPMVVENKPGADTLIGARYIAASAPDGYHAGIFSSSGVSWPYFIREPGVDLIKDFSTAGTIVDGQLIIGSSSKSPFNSIGEMVAYARKNPGKVTWSLSNRTGEPVLYLYLLREKAGIDLLEVPYKGSAPQAQAIIAGEVDIGQFAPGRVVAMQKAGQFKPFAISGTSRDPQLPNVPTMKELGYEGFTNYDFGLFLPAKTQSSIITRWNRALVAALKDPAVMEGLAKFGFIPVGNSPAEHAAQLRTALEAWRNAAKIGNFRPE